MTDSIHTALAQADLLPQAHFVDSGYVTSQTLATSHHLFGVELIGPAPPDVKWQANTEGGFDAGQFQIDWERQQATCPQGHTSLSWTPAIDNRDNQVIKIKFSIKDCQDCPSRSHCIHSEKKYQRRTITIRPYEQHEARHPARRLQRTATFARRYALREGVEATISQGVRAFGMRRSRYIGPQKTHLQHIGIAAAINVTRLIDWLDGTGPSPTRASAFQRLVAGA